MTTIDVKPIYSYIEKYRKMLGHTPTAEHLATTFQQPVGAIAARCCERCGRERN